MEAVSWCQADGETRMSMGFSMHASDRLSRRQAVRGLAGTGLALAGGALLAACSRLGAPGASDRLGPAIGAARGAVLETTRIRFAKNDAACFAPKFVAEDLLRARGFADVQYVDVAGATLPPVSAGDGDMAMITAGIPVVRADADNSVVILAGVHTGCFELFAAPGIRSMSDLRGKTVAVTNIGSGRHVHLAAMLAYVGVDPTREVTWVGDPAAVALDRFASGEIDAFMAFAPEPQELRRRGGGRVIVNTATDRPWSQYFCCVLIANRTFTEQHPVATKAALRAVLEASDICGREPERAARAVVDQGIESNYDVALEAMQEIPFGHWREYDPEDTIRFYALKLQEVGMIKSTPDQIIKNGTDWRFLDELKRELKA
jgi:NitT/TauT family transport system substrate-binding protein